MFAVSWRDLESNAPELATYGRERIDGKVAYLATVKKDGQPRAHPVTPVIGDGHCYIFIDPNSPKANDLKGNGFYCLHCGMSDSSGSSGEFQISGMVELIESQDARDAAESTSNFRPPSRYELFELKLSEALSTAYRGGRPDRRKWLAGEPKSQA